MLAVFGKWLRGYHWSEWGREAQEVRAAAGSQTLPLTCVSG